jgi:hypothetical protein
VGGAEEAADNGEPRQRRSSGEAWRSERRKRSRMGVRECKSESVGSSGTRLTSRRRHGEGELLLASQRRAWRLGRRRRDVEGRGEGQRGSGERRAWRWRARGAEKSGAGQLGLGKVAGEGGGVRARAEHGEGLEVEDRDLSAIF